jgi:hypothetical protein
VPDAASVVLGYVVGGGGEAGAERVGGQRDLPLARTQLGQPLTHRVGVERRRRRPAEPAHDVGREQVLRQHLVLVGQPADDLAGLRQPARRDGVPFAPARGGRHAVTGGERSRGQVVVGQLTGVLDGGEPAIETPALARPAEHRQRHQISRLGRVVTCRVDDRGIGQHSSRRDVVRFGVLVACRPERADDCDLAPVAQLVDARGAPPRIDAGCSRRGNADRLELLGRPFSLAGLGEGRGQHIAQLDQQFDVERGVDQPVEGERARRPVGGGVPLHEADAEVLLDHRAEGDPLVTEQAAGELGVEEPGRVHAELGQAGEVLCRGVQDPFGVTDRGVDRAQVGQGDRIDERAAGSGAAQLNEVGPLAVAIARRPLGVEGDRAGARLEGADEVVQAAGVDQWLGDAVLGLAQDGRGRRWRRLVAFGCCDRVVGIAL